MHSPTLLRQTQLRHGGSGPTDDRTGTGPRHSAPGGLSPRRRTRGGRPPPSHSPRSSTAPELSRTSRTRRARVRGVKGFWMKASLEDSTPWRRMASSV
jgi:hypothetical protein